MGKTDEQKLAELVAEGRELVSTLRGVQKDLRADAKTVRELLDKDAVTRVEETVEKALHEMYAELEKLRIRNFREIEESLNHSFRLLRTAAFGPGRDAEDYVRIMGIVKAAADVFDLQAPLTETQKGASFLINRMIQGAPQVTIIPAHSPKLCADCSTADSVGPCCADPVDREE
jgi:hypothetical protein